MKTWEYGKLNDKFYITDSKLHIDTINKYLFILDLMLSDMNDITLNDIQDWFEDLQKELDKNNED